ncbi:MAG: DoxX family protein [Vicinamibacteria bacterium]
MDRKTAVALSFLLLRIMAGLLFCFAGTTKVFGWFGGIPPAGEPAPIMSQLWIGGLLQVFGGLLITLGLFTRPMAFILSGEMAVVYFQFHSPHGFLPIQNHGEVAVLFCFLFLYLAAHGGGAWSVDAMRHNEV